jgi:hypothetical protein
LQNSFAAVHPPARRPFSDRRRALPGDVGDKPGGFLRRVILVQHDGGDVEAGFIILNLKKMISTLHRLRRRTPLSTCPRRPGRRRGKAAPPPAAQPHSTAQELHKRPALALVLLCRTPLRGDVPRRCFAFPASSEEQRERGPGASGRRPGQAPGAKKGVVIVTCDRVAAVVIVDWRPRHG